MYEDVPTSNMPNKVRVIELVNENVTIPNQLNIQKGQFLLPFFFAPLINITMYLQCMFNVLCFGEFPFQLFSKLIFDIIKNN